MQQIIQHLFRVDSLEEVSRERLEELVSTYPSFSVGRYLLSRKLHTEDAGHFSKETQKTNLYFSNPFWLHWLLQNEVEEQKPIYTRPAPAAVNIEAEETMVEEEQSWGMPDVTEETGITANEEATVTDEFPIARETTIEGEQEDAGESFFQEKLDIEAEAETSAVPDEVEKPGVALTAAGSLLQSLEEARGLRQVLVQMNETKAEEPARHDHIVPVEVKLEETPVEAGLDEILAEAKWEEAPPERKLEETPAEARWEEAPAEKRGEEPIVEFEPYHTIDYFASVGIKLVLEENPSDKLGKQLKSFTEWLKVMRKLPQKNQEIVADVAVEHQIQAIAAHSIKGKEILTETMAEVLVKQGMREKAMDVYHKLSLLNPDKSAYFATKIEQLKID
ncbi:MAG TPA: hypothetical protein VF939_28650 [Puia sp.]